MTSLFHLDKTWVDTFTYVCTLVGFFVGVVHVVFLHRLGLTKQYITRIIFAKAAWLCIVAFSRFAMLIVVQINQNHDKEVPDGFLFNWCWFFKLVEIGSMGISNSVDCLAGVVYLRLVQAVSCESLAAFSDNPREVFWHRIVLFIFCSTTVVSTGLTMSYADTFIVNTNYCLAIGRDEKRNDLFSSFLAMCLCIPFAGTVVVFLASGWVLWTSNVINKDISNKLCGKLYRIRDALLLGMVSYFLTNVLDIFWVIYHPESAEDEFDNRFYLAAAQVTTLQNVTDFMVNVYFFVLPQMRRRSMQLQNSVRFSVTGSAVHHAAQLLDTVRLAMHDVRKDMEEGSMFELSIGSSEEDSTQSKDEVHASTPSCEDKPAVELYGARLSPPGARLPPSEAIV